MFYAVGSYRSYGTAAALVALIAQAATDGAEQWAQQVLLDAQAIVPARTGELKDSGHVELKVSSTAADASVVFDSGHAVHVEFGTGIRGAESAGAGAGPYDPNWKGMPAQPYLRPAFDDNIDKALPIIQASVTEAL